MKFSEMEYKRPDLSTIKETAETIIEEFEKASSPT